MKKWASLIIAAAFVFGPMTAHADIKALEEAAKKEGELTWYVAHYTSEGAEELGAAFAPGRAAAIVTASRSIASDPDPAAAAGRLRAAVWEVSAA